jgi:hypothetical protein
MDLPYRLEESLTLLNTKLQNKGLVFDITVLGSMALHFTGVQISRRTDIDIYNKNIDEQIELLINEVSSELSLAPDWINNRASSIEPLPLDYELRIKTINKFSNINLNIISLDDLIKLKVNAIYSRDEIKDIVDLKSLHPNKEQLNQSIEYIKSQIIFHHGQLELNKKLTELDQFRKELDEKLR